MDLLIGTYTTKLDHVHGIGNGIYVCTVNASVLKSIYSIILFSQISPLNVKFDAPVYLISYSSVSSNTGFVFMINLTVRVGPKINASPS